MPYHKNKQQAFQAAQQGTQEAFDVYENLVQETNANYGSQLKHLKHEVNEAYEQITNAIEVATETQRLTLEKYQHDLQNIVSQVNNFE